MIFLLPPWRRLDIFSLGLILEHTTGSGIEGCRSDQQLCVGFGFAQARVYETWHVGIGCNAACDDDGFSARAFNV